MASQRTPEQIRASIEEHRAELAGSLVVLRHEVTELTDWRKHLRNNQQPVMIGAAVAGFVLGGGIAGVVGILGGRRRRRKRGW
jgi:C4-dicarboxylate-specific signal transduction histidine kinase